MCTKFRQSGISLIELILFIIIVGVGVAGVATTFSVVVRGSADPVVRKQALAIAESLLLEIEQQGFTYCDPQDAKVTTATSTTGCALPANDQNKAGAAFPVSPTPVPTPGSETRGNNADPYDNVADYAGYTAAGSDVMGNNGVVGYAASVVVTRAGGVAPFTPLATFPLDSVLKIAVTVTGHGETVTLVGYRTRYAPNAAG